MSNTADAAGAAAKEPAKTSAKVGDSITLKGNEAGAKSAIVVKKVVDPTKSTDGISKPAAGNRYVAVQFQIKNTGTVAYEDSPMNGAKVADADGQQFDATIVMSVSAGPLLPAAETFKFSTDPELEAKIRDVVGLYVDPPEKAVVVCIDEKTQIQALDRTAPILPYERGCPEKATSDYVRHGTTSLFAAPVSGFTEGYRAQDLQSSLTSCHRREPLGKMVIELVSSLGVEGTRRLNKFLEPPRFHHSHAIDAEIAR